MACSKHIIISGGAASPLGPKRETIRVELRRLHGTLGMDRWGVSEHEPLPFRGRTWSCVSSSVRWGAMLVRLNSAQRQEIKIGPSEALIADNDSQDPILSRPVL